MVANGQPMYAGSDSSSVMQHCSGSSSCKPLSPSQPSSNCRANVRHLVDLSSGSTCCSSSTSSSPHTLMQGPAPPVPSLPASMTQGVMLFTASELRAGDPVAGSSPSHYGSQEQQYATQQYHPYLMSSAHSTTLPRGHYEASNMGTQLYTDDQLVVSYLKCPKSLYLTVQLVRLVPTPLSHVREPVHSGDSEQH